MLLFKVGVLLILDLISSTKMITWTMLSRSLLNMVLLIFFVWKFITIP